MQAHASLESLFQTFADGGLDQSCADCTETSALSERLHQRLYIPWCSFQIVNVYERLSLLVRMPARMPRSHQLHQPLQFVLTTQPKEGKRKYSKIRFLGRPVPVPMVRHRLHCAHLMQATRSFEHNRAPGLLC